MKKIWILLFSILSTTTLSAQVKWMSFEEAVKAQEKEPKKIIIDVYTNWCGPCRMMDAQTFQDKKISEYINKHYYPVKFNAESAEPITFRGNTFENPNYDPNKSGRNGTHQFTQAIAAVNGRIAYPTVVYMNEDFEILSPVQGFLRPPQIEPILKYFGENHYKTIDWEQYQKDFKSDL